MSDFCSSCHTSYQDIELLADGKCATCLANEVEQLRRQISAMRRNCEIGCASAHVLIEAGVVPGFSSSCRCDECRLVAQQMDEAGYLDRVQYRWWEVSDEC